MNKHSIINNNYLVYSIVLFYYKNNLNLIIHKFGIKTLINMIKFIISALCLFFYFIFFKIIYMDLIFFCNRKFILLIC